jgi:hypothetical protein
MEYMAIFKCTKFEQRRAAAVACAVPVAADKRGNVF